MLLRKIQLLALGTVCLSIGACARRTSNSTYVGLSYYESPGNCEDCPRFQIDFHSGGRTALMSTAEMCRYWEIKALLAAGADPRIADKRGRTALQPELVTSPDTNCKTSRELLELAISKGRARK